MPESVYGADDGQQAIDYLAGLGDFADRRKFPLPSIVLLDLKLPYKSGREVLAWIRSQRHLSATVGVVMTSSNQPSDLEEAYRLGANSYVVKPPAAQELVDLAIAFKRYWLDFNRSPGD